MLSDGTGRIYLHLGEHALNGGEECLYVVRKQVPDAADTKAVCVAHFAGVDHEAKITQPIVERWKIEPRMPRKTKRRDDVALVFGGKIGIKAECHHPDRQRFVVGRVSCRPPLDATLLVQLLQGLAEGKKRVSGRCKT